MWLKNKKSGKQSRRRRFDRMMNRITRIKSVRSRKCLIDYAATMA